MKNVAKDIGLNFYLQSENFYFWFWLIIVPFILIGRKGGIWLVQFHVWFLNLKILAECEGLASAESTPKNLQPPKNFESFEKRVNSRANENLEIKFYW